MTKKRESTKLVFKKIPGNSKDHEILEVNFNKKKNTVFWGPKGIVAGTLGIRLSEC